MTNPINLAFKNAKNENRSALISYTVCGDNNKKTSLDILKSISNNSFCLTVNQHLLLLVYQCNGTEITTNK